MSFPTVRGVQIQPGGKYVKMQKQPLLFAASQLLLLGDSLLQCDNMWNWGFEILPQLVEQMGAPEASGRRWRG